MSALVKPRMKDAGGFSLVEMAVVLVIFGLLLGALVLPLSGQIDARNYAETRQQLNNAKEALVGYAIINRRLPCPASSTSNGVEDPVGGGACSNSGHGFLPVVTLGIMPVDSDGYATDSWGRTSSNRIRYVVSQNLTADIPFNYAFTRLDGMATAGINTDYLKPDVLICSSGAGITPTACGAGASTLTTNAVAVIFSLGKNASTGGISTDEAANIDNNLSFVSHDLNADFDDQLTWVPFSTLVNRMVMAGKLP